LDGTKGLRRLIELEGEAQTVFYRWVRKAYLKKGITDVPGLIKRGMSPELADAMKKVRDAYGGAFAAGGFNPRPMKSAAYRYRLGTVSEHGLGNAVDVESKKNPILSAADWVFVEKLAGKTVDRGLKRWQDSPKDLWSDVAELNLLFVANLAVEIAKVAAAQAAATSEATPKKRKKPKRPPEPVDVVLGRRHRALKAWAGGFFTLEWALVEQFHKGGFRWGATFSDVDLHHFELVPKKAAKPKAAK
jgi:hypothetical protein